MERVFLLGGNYLNLEVFWLVTGARSGSNYFKSYDSTKFPWLKCLRNPYSSTCIYAIPNFIVKRNFNKHVYYMYYKHYVGLD